MKSISFLGDSLKRLREFPDVARPGVGYELDKVRRGEQPDDFKPMPSICKGRRRDSDLGRGRYIPSGLHGAHRRHSRRVSCLSEVDANDEQARHRVGAREVAQLKKEQ